MTILVRPHSPPVRPAPAHRNKVEGKRSSSKLAEVVDVAAGRVRPNDPVTPGTGGPAGTPGSPPGWV